VREGRLSSLSYEKCHPVTPSSHASPALRGQHDNSAIAEVLVDALTRRTWIKEDDLAREIKLAPKQVRKVGTGRNLNLSIFKVFSGEGY
jgi:hypothetical protein